MTAQKESEEQAAKRAAMEHASNRDKIEHGGGVGGGGQRVSVGRIVHVMLPGYAQPLAGIVTQVHDNATINVGVFDLDGSLMGGMTNVLRADATDGFPRWFWPPRV